MLVRSLFAVCAAVLCAVPASAAPAPHVSGFVLVALNPQPEPPGVTAVTDLVRVQPGGGLALNPQPEPPGITDARRKLGGGPCHTVMVRVVVEGVTVPTSGYATATPMAGKCAYDIAVPGARPGAIARVKFTRVR